MAATAWLRPLRSALKSQRPVRKPRSATRRLRLEELEDRRVLSVTALNDTFLATPSTPTFLNVLANDVNPSGALQVLSTTPVSPSGPTLTTNADGTLTFTSAAQGTFTFNYTAGGRQQEVTASDGAAFDS